MEMEMFLIIFYLGTVLIKILASLNDIQYIYKL